jgi:superfamily II DNA or RNA helicase
MIELRENQNEFVAGIRHHFAHGSTAPVGVAPTGMGKTACLSEMSRGATEKSNTAMIVVHRQELVLQTSLALSKFGIWHGLIATPAVVRAAIKQQIREHGKSFFNSDAPVTVASVQSLVRQLDSTKPVQFLMLDECHHATAGSWKKVIEFMPDAKLLGVTATPERLDGKGLGVHAGGCFTSMVIGPSVDSLIEQGWLAPPVIYAPPKALDLAGLRTQAGDFARGDTAKKIDSPTITGDAITHYQRYCNGVPAIAFCASVKHAEHVAAQFREAGYQSSCIDGKMNDVDRRAAITGLGEGRLHVLTSCDIVSEGTDIPIVGAAILLRPTKSLGLYLQQVGRVLRMYPGKTHATILDHVGNSMRHGMPEQERNWSLDGRKKRETDTGEAGAPVRQCTSCYSVYRAQLMVCPQCNEPYVPSSRQIMEVDGDLVKVDKEVLKYRRMQENLQAETLPELKELARRRGYKNPDGWARHVANARNRKQQAGQSSFILEPPAGTS